MNWRSISLAALLAALVLVYGTLVKRNRSPATADTQAEQPGYYLRDAIITQTREDGTPGLRLVANRIEQRRRDNSIVMDAVRVNYFESPQHEWLLTAQSGFVPANFRVVELSGDVELRPADAQPTAYLRAEALALDTQANVAYSLSSPVRLRFRQHTMVVKGFRADLNTEKIKMESVNGRFEPQ